MEFKPIQDKDNENNLEFQRTEWYKFVNKITISAVLIRSIIDIVGLSSVTNNSTLDIIAFISLSIDFVLVLVFASKSNIINDNAYYSYFKFSLLTSSLIYYYINNNPMILISILIFLLNLVFLWILALKKVDVFVTRNAYKWMYKAPQDTDIPDRLRGIFYMDGNPNNEDLLTLETGKWDKDNNTLNVDRIHDYDWTFQHNKGGLKYFTLTKLVGFSYKIHFDERIANGDIELYSHCCPIPKSLWKWTIEEIENDDKNYQRRTIKFGYCKDKCNLEFPGYYNYVYILKKVYDKDRNIIDDSFMQKIKADYSISTL